MLGVLLLVLLVLLLLVVVLLLLEIGGAEGRVGKRLDVGRLDGQGRR